MPRTTHAGPRIAILLAAMVLAACAGAKDSRLRLRKVVLYQNGIGYFEHSGHAEYDQLGIPVRRFELDDALKTLTVVRTEDGNETPRHGTVHTMTGDGAASEDASNNAQRTVRMDVQVPGARGEELKITYSVPTPIWKATYRVVLDDAGGTDVVLQGWASIQNTSGHDWNDVSLTLATGAPLSFGVDLTRPVYASRPDADGTMRPPVATGAIKASRTRPGDDDGDGIIDTSDMCPSSAEDLDGFEDDDGCPDPDNDQDRILDVDDLCPGATETYNGIEDADGCPNRGRVVVSSSNIAIYDRVYFRTNSSEIAKASEPILEAIAATLLGNPQVRVVEIGGHGAAKEKKVWQLSEERAIAVAAYLTKMGVPRSRLRIRSYGDSMPVSTDSHAAARAKNRRAEFTVRETRETTAGSASAATGKSGGAGQVRGAVPVPKTSASGGMIHYSRPETVSIADGESTLLPLVNTLVEGEEIYLYRPQSSLPGSDQHPSRAARIVNSGTLALVPGPVAVFARQAFAGEGLIDSLNPGDSAFIPFALDRSATVTVRETRSRTPKQIASISEGTLWVVDQHEIATEYTIGAGLTPPSRAFVQHEGHPGYQLTPPPGAEAEGSTTLVPVRLSGGRNATLRLREHEDRKRSLSIAHDSATEIRSYLAAGSLAAAVASEVERVLSLRAEIALAEGTLGTLRSQRFDGQLRAHEIRENLEALSNDQGALRANLKKELAESEKRGSQLASRIAVLSETLSKTRIEVQALIASLSLKPR